LAKKNPHLSKVEVETHAMETMLGIDPERLPVVKFLGDKITVEFDGHHIENQVKVVSHEFWSASYDRSKPIVTIDDNMPKTFWRETALHESLEKHLVERGLEDIQAHEVAEDVEKRWFLTHYSEDEWDEYQREAERVHRKEWKHIEKMLPEKYRKTDIFPVKKP
jgi:hypothetical protein